jgi:AcrR family transcriptional regulator
MDDLQSRSTERFAAKREAILDAAARVFNAKGIRGGTLSDVAASVGLATNSVTYYYRRHEELATACLLRSIEALNRTIDLASAHHTIAERVNALFADHLSILASIQRGQHAELITFADARAIGAPHSETISSAYNAASKRVRQLLIGEQTANLSKDELSARNYLLISQVSWMRLWTPVYDAAEYDNIAQRMSDLTLRGLHMPAAHWGTSQPEAAFWHAYKDMPEIADPFLCAAAALVNQHGFQGALRSTALQLTSI